MGLALYYPKLIYNFSQIAYPLTRLTQTNRHFEWTEKKQKCFQYPKKTVDRVSWPVLSYPDTKDTDASALGVGAVLSLIQNDRKTVIAYESETLSKSQPKYCQTYREHLAVVLFIKIFEICLDGWHFLLGTDQSSLPLLKTLYRTGGYASLMAFFL